MKAAHIRYGDNLLFFQLLGVNRIGVILTTHIVAWPGARRVRATRQSHQTGEQTEAPQRNQHEEASLHSNDPQPESATPPVAPFAAPF